MRIVTIDLQTELRLDGDPTVFLKLCSWRRSRQVMIRVRRTLSATEMAKYGIPKLTATPENKLESGLEIL